MCYSASSSPRVKLMWHLPRSSSQTRGAAASSQNHLDYAVYAQPSKLGVFSQTHASILPCPNLSRPGFDALHSPQQLLPLAPVQNAFDLLSTEDQQHHPRAEWTGS